MNAVHSRTPASPFQLGSVGSLAKLADRMPLAFSSPAGLENAKGILSAGSFKDPTDPRWQDDAGFRQWTAFMDKYYPEGDKTDSGTVTGYSIAQTLVQVLKQCDGTLTGKM